MEEEDFLSSNSTATAMNAAANGCVAAVPVSKSMIALDSCSSPAAATTIPTTIISSTEDLVGVPAPAAVAVVGSPLATSSPNPPFEYRVTPDTVDYWFHVLGGQEEEDVIVAKKNQQYRPWNKKKDRSSTHNNFNHKQRGASAADGGGAGGGVGGILSFFWNPRGTPSPSRRQDKSGGGDSSSSSSSPSTNVRPGTFTPNDQEHPRHQQPKGRGPLNNNNKDDDHDDDDDSDENDPPKSRRDYRIL